MRQALTTMIVGLSLALSPLAQVSARATDAAGTIARARRLIEAKDYSPATILLEELLPEADANDRRSILELLRQSYEAMAREAKAAGNDREAAQFRDNIAIINRAQGVVLHPAKSSEGKTKKPAASPKPVMNANTTSDATGTTDLLPSAPSRSLPPVSAQGSPPASPPELPPVSEPAKMPEPEKLPVLPKDLKLFSSPASDAAIKASTPLLSQNDAAPDDGSAMTRLPQTDAAVIASKSPILISAPEKSDGRGEPSPKSPKPSLEEGDRLFTAGRYDEAGRCYAALARESRLPARRNVHWAYCRYRGVANRINHQPRTTREWDEIASEITSIQRLAPNIWYGEYLRKKVAEVRRSGRSPVAKSDNLVVRGSEPDESQKQPDPQSRRFPRLFGKSRAVTSAQTEAAPVVASPSGSGERPLNLPGDSSDSSQPAIASAAEIGTGADPTSTGSGSAAQSRPARDAAVKRASADAEGVAWQLYETPNFRVFHQDARLAAAAGNAAESVRAAQAKRWASPAGERPWTPACDLYLYPSGKVFARETQQPETSPGFSTMMCNGNRVVARRINLRADHPLLVTAILPHEVTHVVLADLFTDQ
jgi:hypothetical protein